MTTNLRRFFSVEVEVYEGGRIETTFLSNGTPMQGAGDSTNTLPTRQMIQSMVEPMIASAEHARSLATEGEKD